MVTNTSKLLTLSNFNSRLQQSQSSLLQKRQLDAKYWPESPGKLILFRLNIYSIRNKFDAVKFIIDNNRYVFGIKK